MNNLAASVNARYLELLGKKAEIPENGYHGADIIDTARAIIEQDGDKYLQTQMESSFDNGIIFRTGRIVYASVRA